MMHIKSNILKTILIFLFISVKGIFAGTFQLTPVTIDDYSSSIGLIYSTDGNIVKDKVGVPSPNGCTIVGFCSTVPPASLNIGPFNIRQGQEWDTLTINITGGGANSVDIYILSESQVILSTMLANTSATTVDLTTLTQLSNGTAFSIKLVFNGTAVVTSIDVLYTGNTILCYPSPYIPLSGEELTIIYEADEESLASLKIYDNRGRHVKTIFYSYHINAGSYRSQNNTTWDGTNEAGVTVNSGVYTIIFSYVPIGSTGSSYTAKFEVLVVR